MSSSRAISRCCASRVLLLASSWCRSSTSAARSAISRCLATCFPSTFDGGRERMRSSSSLFSSSPAIFGPRRFVDPSSELPARDHAHDSVERHTQPGWGALQRPRADDPATMEAADPVSDSSPGSSRFQPRVLSDSGLRFRERGGCIGFDGEVPLKVREPSPTRRLAPSKPRKARILKDSRFDPKKNRYETKPGPTNLVTAAN